MKNCPYKIISVDIMIGDRFIATIKINLTLDLISDYIDDVPAISYNALIKHVEERKPSLKGKDYRIIFNNL